MGNGAGGTARRSGATANGWLVRCTVSKECVRQQVRWKIVVRGEAIVRESERDASGGEMGRAVAYRRRHSRVCAHGVRVVEQWSTQGAHCEVGSNKPGEEYFLWNGFASGTKWKVGEPSVADRRIRVRYASIKNRKQEEYKR